MHIGTPSTTCCDGHSVEPGVPRCQTSAPELETFWTEQYSTVSSRRKTTRAMANASAVIAPVAKTASFGFTSNPPLDLPAVHPEARQAGTSFGAQGQHGAVAIEQSYLAMSRAGVSSSAHWPVTGFAC